MKQSMNLTLWWQKIRT